MIRTKKYSKFWKKELQFDYAEELTIYKWLCGIRLIKKPKMQFVRKKAWCEYIWDKYEDVNGELLQEFYWNLNYLKCTVSMEDDVNGYFLIPFFVALFTGFTYPEMIKWYNNLYSNEDNPIIVTVICSIIGALLIVFFMAWGVWTIVKVVHRNKIEKLFLEDYMGIIKNVLEKDEVCD